VVRKTTSTGERGAEMARILQQDLFGWKSVKLMPALERFTMVRDTLDDECLVSELERQRGKGRDDYPVRPMWNAVVFFPLTGHTTWKSYVRELERNRDLLAVCGFPVGCKAPAEWVMSRFLKKVKGLRVLVDDIIHRAIDVLGELLPDFCEHLGIDSQAFNSSAQKRSDKKRQDGQPDERGEHDAENSKKLCPEKDGDAWVHSPMVFKGYEKDRQTVKYTCPAAHYGTDCPGKQECEKGYGRCVRVKLAVDPRVFVPTPRHTIKFERGYRRRTAVERINGLFNELFGIKRMKVRGLPSARLRVSMMVMTVQTMAVARIHNDQKEKMTSIVAAA